MPFIDIYKVPWLTAASFSLVYVSALASFEVGNAKGSKKKVPNNRATVNNVALLPLMKGPYFRYCPLQKSFEIFV